MPNDRRKDDVHEQKILRQREMRLDELIEPNRSGYEMPMFDVRRRVLRILGYVGANQNRSKLTDEQSRKLAEFTDFELRQFQRVCSIMSDPDNQNAHHRQWMDRALLGSDPEGASAMFWMNFDEMGNDMTECNETRIHFLKLLGQLLDPDLGLPLQYKDHPALQIRTFDKKALSDIKLRCVYEKFAKEYRSNLGTYKPRYIIDPNFAHVRADANAFQTCEKMLRDIDEKAQVAKPEIEPLIVQLLKATTFNRATFNVNQHIHQLNASAESLRPLMAFIDNCGFRLRRASTEEMDNKRIVALFDVSNCHTETHWRRLNETKVSRIRKRADDVWNMALENVYIHSNDAEVQNERREYSFFLTLIMCWSYCTKEEFKANLRNSKERDLVSVKPSSKLSILEASFHRTQVDILRRVQLFDGAGLEALNNLIKHRRLQYAYDQKIIDKLRGLSLEQLCSFMPIIYTNIESWSDFFRSQIDPGTILSWAIYLHGASSASNSDVPNGEIGDNG
ncbi:hypothetical protein [Vibrio sp. RW]|uniref:hypothetical protein n=1 Tax=Vibrio sp. RW TaxID=2998833 RepID=UPI0022CD5152|nr:hypothetical protein [Vibrio sp. RW]